MAYTRLSDANEITARPFVVKGVLSVSDSVLWMRKEQS